MGSLGRVGGGEMGSLGCNALSGPFGDKIAIFIFEPIHDLLRVLRLSPETYKFQLEAGLEEIAHRTRLRENDKCDHKHWTKSQVFLVIFRLSVIRA